MLYLPVDTYIVWAVIVDNRRSLLYGRLDIKNSREFLIFHLDQAYRLLSGLLVNGRDSRYFIADKPHLIHGQGILILCVGEKAPVAVFNPRDVFPGDDTLDPHERFGLFCVDTDYPRVDRKSTRLNSSHG